MRWVATHHRTPFYSQWDGRIAGYVRITFASPPLPCDWALCFMLVQWGSRIPPTDFHELYLL